ncbi:MULTISPECIES: flagellar biosynthetic protein FliQ [unclassified Sphingobium]|uniref:flagellar biosynthetic protein FliQ n=1 Tax=unclassified Sphingobium TaxID=2611147 RepID=UPI0007F3F3B2|nr:MULTISPECIES: flagellar biosynthetic protein FliQ [unclassified Sphingobium]OAN52571.1 flagellar biosynthetic protein FliQ [Sphingobium sp. TCM1]WIW90889.1 flagellar biosynthetic protein FliQ [Sphingobium sp. V4]
MASTDVMEIVRAALMLVLTIAGPMLIAALIVGVAIGLLQALTQVQEMTLTFVPKLVVLGIVLLLSLPMIGQALSVFMDRIADAIVHG